MDISPATFSPVQSFQNIVFTAKIINSQDMVRLSSQPHYRFLFMLWKISNTPDFDKLNGL